MLRLTSWIAGIGLGYLVLVLVALTAAHLAGLGSTVPTPPWSG
ncbi:hypothetical protein AB0J42_31900 [Nonomuraea sp. NPDC049649]